MRLRELIELGGPERRQGDANNALAGRIRAALDQAVGHGAIDQSHNAVVAKHQVVGYLADRRAGGVGVALDRQ
jgi:hypothetical protein